jgi:hypothetical protein
MRSAGTVQVFSSRSTLGYLVPSASPARAAGRVANSSAGAATAPRSRRWATKPARVREGNTSSETPDPAAPPRGPGSSDSSRVTSCGPVEELTQRIGRDEPAPGRAHGAKLALFDKPIERRPAQAGDYRGIVDAISKCAVGGWRRQPRPSVALSSDGLFFRARRRGLIARPPVARGERERGNRAGGSDI